MRTGDAGGGMGRVNLRSRSAVLSLIVVVGAPSVGAGGGRRLGPSSTERVLASAWTTSEAFQHQPSEIDWNYHWAYSGEPFERWLAKGGVPAKNTRLSCYEWLQVVAVLGGALTRENLKSHYEQARAAALAARQQAMVTAGEVDPSPRSMLRGFEAYFATLLEPFGYPGDGRNRRAAGTRVRAGDVLFFPPSDAYFPPHVVLATADASDLADAPVLSLLGGPAIAGAPRSEGAAVQQTTVTALQQYLDEAAARRGGSVREHDRGVDGSGATVRVAAVDWARIGATGAKRDQETSRWRPVAGCRSENLSAQWPQFRSVAPTGCERSGIGRLRGVGGRSRRSEVTN